MIRFEENKLINGFSGDSMPNALEMKYPNSPREPGWQYVFPSRKPAIDPVSGKLKQHCRHESVLQKELKNAVRKSGIHKNGSCHSFRHSFALIFWRMGMESLLYRNCLAIRTFELR